MTMDSPQEQLDFVPLVERPDAIAQVARWWCDEWGLPGCHQSFEAYVGELASLELDDLPFHLLALSEAGTLGVATLKGQSALYGLFPDSRYWLSGVYVPPALRRKGIASALCLKMIDVARTKGAQSLHLVTEALDGGLYADIGWEPIRRVQVDNLDLLAMVRSL